MTKLALCARFWAKHITSVFSQKTQKRSARVRREAWPGAGAPEARGPGSERRRRRGLPDAGWGSTEQSGGWARAAGGVRPTGALAPRVDAAAAAAAMDALEEESFALSL